MTCSACNDNPVNNVCEKCGKLPPVLQVTSEECPVVFHTVELEGTAEDNPPYIGRYKNTLLTYTADSAKYLFNSDGIYTPIAGSVDFNDILNRPKYAGEYMTSDTDIPDVNATVETAVASEVEARNAAIAVETTRATEAENNLSSAISDETTARVTADAAIEGKLNATLISDLEMNTDATAVEFIENKKNLLTGTTSTETDTIPLASETQAGILNAAGYQSIKNSQDRLDALAGGAVSVSGLSANPTQSQLTAAWKTATGQEEVFNRASIFDSTNGKNWTYFDNTNAWEVTGEINQTITLDNFSLGQAGLITGDNTDGKVYAEQDGTGSVYGWDALKSRVSNTESDIASLGTGKQDKLTAGSNISITNNTISATDTTYSDFVGTDGSTDGTAGLVPAPLIADDGKYLKADGSWGTPPGTTYTAGANISITGNTISATDTTYSDFTGTDGTAAGVAGLVPAPATTDVDKYLKSDGTWATVSSGSSVNVVQTTGTSTTDVMSQVAASNLIYPSGYETNKSRIYIPGRSSSAANRIAIGTSTNPSINGFYSGLVTVNALNGYNIAISGGLDSRPAVIDSSAATAIAIGSETNVNHRSSIALGYYTQTGRDYELSIGGSGITRYIANVTDPQLAQDAATKNYVDTAIASASAPTYTVSEFNTLWQEA